MVASPLDSGPLIYAHRGDRSRAPDNTLEAYLLAIEAGADGVELDVRRTLDGILILHHEDHDPLVGTFASTTSHDLRDAAPQIPTLREALDAIPSNVFINVEIKNNKRQAGFDEERLIVDQAVAEIRAHDDPARILVSSFDSLAMRRAGEVAPEFLRGQLIVNPVTLDVGIGLAQKFGMDGIHPELSYLRDGPDVLTQALQGTTLRTVVWGVNSPEAVAILTEAGVNAIITDDPGMAREVVGQR